MSTINRVPVGLQSLLDSKTLGENPSDLGQVVSPTIDLTTFLLSGRGLNISDETTLAVAADTNAGIIEVPLGKIWIIYCVSATSTALTAGATIEASPRIDKILGDVNATQVLASEPQFGTTYAIGSVLFVTTGWLATPIVLRNTNRIYSAARNVGGSWNVTTAICYYELDV